MPRKYIKKADRERLEHDANVSRETVKGEEPTAKDMLAEVMANQNEIMRQNIELKAENKKLAEALIQNPAEGGRRIVGGEERFELPIQEEPMDTKDYAVFTSPSPGLWQKLIPGKKSWMPNGESEIADPIFARFERGVCVLMEPEEIELMRERYKKDKIKGTIKFVEITDAKQKEDARKGLLGVRSIKSQTVTSETPLSDLV